MNFNEIHIWKKLTILNLLVVSEIGELGWTQTRVEFDSATNRGVPSSEAIQANPGKGNKQPVNRAPKKWKQEENGIVMEYCYKCKPKINGYRHRMNVILKDKGMFNITEQKRRD